MIPTALVISKIDNQVRSRWQIFRNPIGATDIGHFVKTGTDSNGADAGVVAALVGISSIVFTGHAGTNQKPPPPPQ